MCWSWNNVRSVDAKMIMKPALVYRILCKSASWRHIKHFPHDESMLYQLCAITFLCLFTYRKILNQKWHWMASLLDLHCKQRPYISLYPMYKPLWNVLRFCKLTKSVVVNLGKTVEVQVRRLHLWRLFMNSSESAWTLYYWMIPSDSYDCLIWVSS